MANNTENKFNPNLSKKVLTCISFSYNDGTEIDLAFKEQLEINLSIDLTSFLLLIGKIVNVNIKHYDVNFKFIDASKKETYIEENKEFKEIISDKILPDNISTENMLFAVVLTEKKPRDLLKNEKYDNKESVKKKEDYKVEKKVEKEVEKEAEKDVVIHGNEFSVFENHNVKQNEPLKDKEENKEIEVLQPKLSLSEDDLKIKKANELLTEIISLNQSDPKDINLNKLIELDSKYNSSSSDILNLKTKMDSVYESVFNKELSHIINQILTKTKDKFNNMINFSMETVPIDIRSISNHCLSQFNEKIEKLSCKWVFENFEKKFEKEVNSIIEKLTDFYTITKQAYLLDRELSKETKRVFETETKKEMESYVERYHGKMIYKYPCCGKTNKNAEGCKSFVEKFDIQGNRFVKFASFGIFGGDETMFDIKAEHREKYGEFCENCNKSRDSKPCMAEVKEKEKVNKDNKPIIKEINFNYIKVDWDDRLFKLEALNFLRETLKTLYYIVPEQKLKESSENLNLGDLLYQQGKFIEADSAYKKALELNPKNSKAQLILKLLPFMQKS